ncbi:unnamed protein product [Paramecium primaurelia]|uniref:protein-tyrosine-phosphatase n=1 Tax=Paramecium primaurelia TaxID=5886 RepID=A0A8S1N245_PARPR|nr:unnamed protein product [Paramecium primaurelia]
MYMHINEMDLILPSMKPNGALWLGNIKAAQNIQNLSKENIRTVITVASNVNISYPKHQKIIHKIFKVHDKENVTIQELIEMTNEEIEEGMKIGSVLVHCMAGISRSATCVIAYLMYQNKWVFEKTLKFVKSKRPCVNPNEGFKKQLISYSNEIQKKLIPKKTQQIDNPLAKLRRQLHQSPEDLIKNTQLARSPKHEIKVLTKDSTEEEKQQYRQQLAQKLFVNTFSTTDRNRQQLKTVHINKSTNIKGYISMYKQVEEQKLIGFLSDRFN